MKKIIDLCKEVPLLPLTILAAIPLALIPQWRPWGHIHPAFDPGVGEWIIICSWHGPSTRASAR